jgi:hypothetical protein
MKAARPEALTIRTSAVKANVKASVDNEEAQT